MDKKESQNKDMPQMAVFDIDGTITHANSMTIPKEILEGFAHLRSKGIITTVCTGRPYVRVKRALGKNFDDVIDDKALISVEHGAKIVDKSGKLVVQSAFDNADMDKLIEFTGLNIDMVQFFAYNPADLSKKTQIWCPEPLDVPATQEERGWYADVFGSTLEEVQARLYIEPVGNITIKLKSFIHVENLKLEFTGASIKAVFQDGAVEFMKSKVNKARAITYVRKHFGIYEHHLLVAGNAINDVNMLNMEAGYRILVGSDSPERDTILGYMYAQEHMKFVNTPEELGIFLLSL